MNHNDKIKTLTEEIERIEPECHKIYCELREREGHPEQNSIQSLRSTIGGKNNEFADCERNSFASSDDYYAKWMYGLLVQKGNEVIYGPDGPVHHILLEMLQRDVSKRYIELFVKRNYYREYNSLTRFKPKENLYDIWFGQNGAIWRLMLSPVYRNGEWTNDKSKARHAKYEYWTIGHVLTTGLVQSSNPRPVKFQDVSDLLDFYNKEMQKKSHSKRERGIADRYCDYIGKCANAYDMPFLIPEFRLKKDVARQKYRLDFTVLNPYMRKFTGFEISPAFSHMRVREPDKCPNKTLKKNWEKEMDKRNRYLDEYDISVVTFTDSKMKYLDAWFERIRNSIEERPPRQPSIEEVEMNINQLFESNPI